MTHHVPARFDIVARQDFSDVTYLLEIAHPMMARVAQPGQFVMVMLHEHGERIPLTIADFDRDTGTITLVIQAVGKTTREMQQACRPGTALHAVVGPMGVPSPLGHARKVLCVGGGLGVAPVFPQARGFKQQGAFVIGVLGFRTKPLVFWEEKFRSCCDELIVCTDDGSAGMAGKVTDGMAHAIPAGPDPTMPMRNGRGSMNGMLTQPCSIARSPTHRSRRPMATGSSVSPTVQTPSHCDSCGQTRPQTAGSRFVAVMTS